MEVLLNAHWHHMDAETALDLLDSSAENGLDRFEVGHRQERFGPNRIETAKERSPWVLFLLQFHQPLVYILIAAGLVTGFVVEWVDASVILLVVLVNAVIGFVQESKAAGAMAALAGSVTTEAVVIRAGVRQVVPSVDLVPGDIVLLQSGDKVPADLRLVRLRDLRIDESALTGESLPVDKTTGVLDRDTVLADRRNMAYASTLVTYGQGAGCVVAIGGKTEIGRISALIAEAEVLQTPLTKKIAVFSRWLMIAILVLGGLTFLAGVWRGQPVIDMFMAAVALTVGAIPEGLPAAVTIILAIGVSRMAQRKAIVRKLPAVETLGSTSLICSDKTGTLTQNQMTVNRIWTGVGSYTVSGGGYDPHGRIAAETAPGDSASDPALAACLRAGLLCNDAQIVTDGDRWTIQGDPTEGALIVAARKMGLQEEAEAARLRRVDSLPFESEHQYMATLHRAGDGSGVVFLKGAVERVLSRCDGRMGADGAVEPLDPEAVAREAEDMAMEGLRVLAFAERGVDPGVEGIGHGDITSGFTFLGLQGMIDPPREEARASVAACRRAGVRVKMITGDHAVTAAAVARQIGILDEPADGRASPLVMTGAQIAGLKDDALMDAADRTGVFARVAPEQKLRLVEALQARGHVVAMTGDGVNDAPALKQADIGIAMGREGTEVAREAADMVLTDDNFSTIRAAVEEGRGVFDNLVKFIVWALPTNLGQGLVILTAVFAGVPLPILPVQSLWINMTTAGSLGLMLAFEPKERGLMERPPRNPRQPLLGRAYVVRIMIVGFVLLAAAFGLFEWEVLSGASEAQARTVAVNVFAVISIGYLFNCRSLTQPVRRLGFFSNPWILAGIGLMAALQLLLTYLPAFNRLFHTAPIGLDAWARILAAAVVSYGIVAVDKRLRRRSAPAGGCGKSVSYGEAPGERPAVPHPAAPGEPPGAGRPLGR